MNVPKLTTAMTLVLAVTLAACASNENATRSPDAAAAAAAAGPTAKPAPKPSPTPTAVATATLVPLPSAQPMSLLWESHGPVSNKTSTTYIALNPIDGRVWVGVPFENRFWIFSPDGKYLESWGESGKGPGQFDFSDHAQNPNGFTPIAFAPDGSFYVGDTGNHRVQHFDADRAYLGEWGSFGTGDGKFVQITSIAADGEMVYVGDGDRYDIQGFDADGAYMRTIGEDGGYSSVALGTDGRIVATNPSNPSGNPPSLTLFGSDGVDLVTTVLPVPSADALQPVVSADGRIFVNLEQNAFPWTPKGVIQLDPDGRVVRVFEGGGDFIGVSPDGQTLYVSRGIQLDTTQWTFVRGFSLTGS
jgi:sugar lactone lactonase YvrE